MRYSFTGVYLAGLSSVVRTLKRSIPLRVKPSGTKSVIVPPAWRRVSFSCTAIGLPGPMRCLFDPSTQYATDAQLELIVSQQMEARQDIRQMVQFESDCAAGLEKILRARLLLEQPDCKEQKVKK